MSTTTLQHCVNSHWAAFVADPKDPANPVDPADPIEPRRRPRPTHSHWAALVEGGDEDEDLDEEEDTGCRRRRRRRPQKINSHWASGVVEDDEDLDHESEGDNDPFADEWKRLLGPDGTGKSAGAVDKSSSRNNKAPTGANEKETGGKTKRYSRNKPRLPTKLS